MDVQPVDQGAILRSGAATVPNLFEDQIRQQLAGAQVQQAQNEAAHVATETARQQYQQQRQQSYAADIAAYQAHPTSQGLVDIMARYPEFSEGAKRAYDAQDQQQRDGDFQFAAEVHDAAQGGHYDIAARRLRERDEADRAAGHPPDPTHAAILADLESGDPARQRAATEALSGTVAIMAGPERYAAVYGAQHPQEALHEVNGILYNNQGVAVAQDPRGRVIPGPNGSFMQLPPVPNIPMLGGGSPVTAPAQGRQDGGAFDFTQHPTTAAPATPATGRGRTGANAHPVTNAGAIVSQLYPSAQITSTRRDPNSALGRANPNSWHNTTGAAVDVRPIPGMTFNQYVSGIRARGYQIIEARDEVTRPARDTTGPNWHVVIGQSRPGPGTVARINTAQQYASLPVGAEYIDPQGNHRVKH